MLKSTSFSFFVLAFVALLAGQGQAKPKPGLLDFFKGDECKKIDDNSCAIVYDDEDCGEGIVNSNKGPSINDVGPFFRFYDPPPSPLIVFLLSKISNF